MTDLGDFIDSKQMVIEADVASEAGLQSGIFFNKKESKVVVVQTIPDGKPPNYPNQWDEKSIGVVLFCGTNKGQTKDVIKQNRDSELNNKIYSGSFPIFLYYRYPGQKYRFMGEFTRLPKYDDELEFKGKIILRFGLVSNNIDAARPIIKDLINRGLNDLNRTNLIE